MRNSPLDTVAFAERVLALLEEGSFSATYKFAVLAALMELCLEGTTSKGDPPEQVTTVQLASKVLELYWRQVTPYGDAQVVLEQNAGPAQRRAHGPTARILRLLYEYRARHGKQLTLHEARLAQPRAFARLQSEIEWTLVAMPLPKLQRFGNSEDRFIYTITWDDSILRGQWADKGRSFQNQIEFVDHAASHLVRLSSLLRPLIQQKWAAKVAELNRLKVGTLERFLFGADRVALDRVARPLLELQGTTCFYCRARIQSRGHVDHFIPWSRHADDGLDNLVVAHERCNLEKRNFLAGIPHLSRWVDRATVQTGTLGELASRIAWPRDPDRTLGSVRGAYMSLPPGQQLWIERQRFEPAERATVRRLLGD